MLGSWQHSDAVTSVLRLNRRNQGSHNRTLVYTTVKGLGLWNFDYLLQLPLCQPPTSTPQHVADPQQGGLT